MREQAVWGYVTAGSGRGRETEGWSGYRPGCDPFLQGERAVPLDFVSFLLVGLSQLRDGFATRQAAAMAGVDGLADQFRLALAEADLFPGIGRDLIARTIVAQTFPKEDTITLTH